MTIKKIFTEISMMKKEQSIRKNITHQGTLCDDHYLQSMETYAKDMNIPRC